MNDTPVLQAPSGTLAKELAQVKSSAENLQRRLKEANSLPDDFPTADLDFLAGTLMETPRMSSEGAMHALIYGRHKLSDIRSGAIHISTDAAQTIGDGSAAVLRGEMIDIALLLLVGDIGTALNCYGGTSVADAEGPPDGDRVPSAPNDSDYAEIARTADEIADRADAAAGKIEPTSPELKSIELGVRDVATLERQTGYEVRTTRHIGRLERLGNGVRAVIRGAEIALRGVQLVAVVGSTLHKFINEIGEDIFEAVEKHAAELERKLAARRKQWWDEQPGQPRPLYKPFTSFRDRLADGSHGHEMIFLPAGQFWMGSTVEEQKRFELEADWAKSESPRHLVNISDAFALGRYPVTFADYDAYCDQTGIKKPDDEKWGRKTRPVINVNHEEASAYCAWLSDRTGSEYRLPSEVEWEYACRAGTQTAYWWGDDWDKAQANGERGLGKTSEVGTYPPNPWGLHDTHGNVWEWCADHWSEGYEPPRSQHPFLSEDKSSRRVLRGGSWGDGPRDLRSADRGRNWPDYRIRINGFRLARTLTS